MKNKIIKTVKVIFVLLLGCLFSVIYCPVYVTGWALHKVFRFLLALSYFMMLEWRVGSDIIKNLFKKPE